MLTITETNRKWWILAAMTASLSMVFIDQTALTVALPQMQRDFNLTNISLQWVVNAYLLALASLVIMGGKLGDVFSHRKTFICGVLIFMGASILCALAHSGVGVVISRILQGVGGALLIPATSTIVVTTFPDEERGKAMGIYVGSASIFLALGPLVGGLLTEYLSWRWVFWLNLPIAMIGISLIINVMPPVKKTEFFKLDWLGFFLISGAMLSLVLALMEAVNWGWTSSITLSLLSVSIASIALFSWQEKFQTHPFIELALFRNASFLYSILNLLIIQCMGMAFVFWAIYLQTVLHFSPFMGGVAVLPIMLPLTFMATVAGKMRDKYGARLPMFLGNLLVGLSFIWIAIAATRQSYVWLFPGFLTYGLAVPLVIGNCMVTALASIEHKQRGMASGLLSGARQLGGCLGLAIITSFLVGINHYQLDKFIKHATGDIASLNIHQLDSLLTGTSMAIDSLKTLSAADAQFVYNNVIHAYIYAFSHTMLLISILAFIACLLTLKLPSKNNSSSSSI